MKQLKLQPLNDNIFLEYVKAKETKSGILLSDVSKHKPAKAKVLAVGPGRMDRFGTFVKTTLKVGDTIIIDPFLPREIQIDGIDYLVVKESEIFAKLV